MADKNKNPKPSEERITNIEKAVIDRSNALKDPNFPKADRNPNKSDYSGWDNPKENLSPKKKEAWGKLLTAREKFAKLFLDLDGDGKVSVKEANPDKNNDGKLSPAEKKEFMDKHGKNLSDEAKAAADAIFFPAAVKSGDLLKDYEASLGRLKIEPTPDEKKKATPKATTIGSQSP